MYLIKNVESCENSRRTSTSWLRARRRLCAGGDRPARAREKYAETFGAQTTNFKGPCQGLVARVFVELARVGKRYYGFVALFYNLIVLSGRKSLV